MEVRSESGVMSVREPFSVGMQKTPVLSSPPMPSMRLAYAADGTAVYKPVSTVSMASPPPYQGGGGGPGGGGGGGAGGGGTGATVTATTPAAAATPAATPVSSDRTHSPTLPPNGLPSSTGEPMKRKRGRPRKYAPDGTMALALVPVSPTVTGATPVSGTFSPPSLPGTASPLSSPGRGPVTKKTMGRPRGSSRKQQMDALGSAGIGFTPHVITVLAGEDVSSKIMSFSQHGPRAVCVLSANGAISTVTLRQTATSGGTVTYEGRFEILSLSGSYLLSESSGQRSRTGGLSVCLSGPDGRVLGGGVAGLLTAASPVQVVVGSFIADGRKEPKLMVPVDPASAPGKITPSGLTGAASPPLRGTMSGSSGGPESPPNASTGTCSDSNKQGMPNMPWK